MNIRQIENGLGTIASAVNAIGDVDMKSCMTEVLQLVSEVRLYSNSMKEADFAVDGSFRSSRMKEEAQDRIMHYLNKFL